MAEIVLTSGRAAVVDDIWLPILSQWEWYWHPGRNGKPGYAVRQIGGRNHRQTVFMHRYVVMAPEGWEVDHANGNSLDNRESNLRVIVPAKNYCNRPAQANNKTGFKGVSFDKARNTFNAHIQHNRKQYNLGRFETAEAAALAYDASALELFGEIAWLNFPPPDHDQYQSVV